mgnify:FL=1|jgi:flagellar biosynthesis protein FlhB
MAESSSDEKTEAPSQKRREDARKEGQVAFSKEVSSCALLGGFLLLLYFSGNIMLQAYKDVLIYAFTNLDWPQFTIPNLQNFLDVFLTKGAVIVAPFFGVSIVVGVLSSVIQVGVNLTLKPLIPKFEKISPLKGIGRLFSKQAFNELVKTIFKMCIIGYIGYYTYVENIEQMVALINTNPQSLATNAASIIAIFIFRLFLALLVMAVFDYMFQRWDLEQKLKMSKQEMKEELKQSEGDPALKARIRQIQQQLSQARMMQEVPGADVVISNPTHFAIALQYDREIMRAPRVIAKGADHIALRIIEIAGENDIIVYRNPPVARGMYFQVEIGDEVPEDFYKAVAEILAFVYKTKKKLKK